MSLFRKIAGLALLTLLFQPARAEYLEIELRVLGLDCELCARGVSKSIGRLPGVESVNVTLKTGVVKIVLKPGNTLKMSAVEARIRENGFTWKKATATAFGRARGSNFVVVGPGDSYALPDLHPDTGAVTELTFDVP